MADVAAPPFGLLLKARTDESAQPMQTEGMFRMVTLDLIILIAYMVGILGAGFWAKRKVTSQEEFLVAGRSVGPWLYAGTLAAIVLGGASTVGGVKLGYQYGISGMWLVFMFGLGILVLSTVLVPRILDLNLYTVPELLERRYSASARIAGGIVMVAYDFMVAVTATIAVGAVMEVIVGIPRTQAIFISSAVMVAYSVFGGMWSLTVTDIVQFVIKTVGILFILLPAAIIHAGGLGVMQQRLPAGFFSPTHIGGAKIFSFFLLYFFGIILGQDVWQRVFTARSIKVARTGGIAVGIYCLAYAMAGALIGTAGHVFLPELADPDSAFANIVNAVLPVGLRGLVLAASLAAMMSTASACLLASSTVLLEDVYLRLKGSGTTGSVTQSRVVTFVFGVLMTLVACRTNDVIAAVTVAYDLLVGALLIPVVGAMLWRRGTGAGALSSIAVSATAVVVLLSSACYRARPTRTGHSRQSRQHRWNNELQKTRRRRRHRLRSHEGAAVRGACDVHARSAGSQFGQPRYRPDRRADRSRSDESPRCPSWPAGDTQLLESDASLQPRLANESVRSMPHCRYRRRAICQPLRSEVAG
jgi:SSS family solute:Na+ symporter